MKKMIYNNESVSGCFFRSTVPKPNIKVLLQVTERCNMSCVHCFNASNAYGADIKIEDLKKYIIPKLQEAKVTRVTLTGGEPMVHPQIYEIVKLFQNINIHITLCTNGLLFDKELIDKLNNLGNVHINVSLDGFTYNSHGRFRGIKQESNYNKIIDNIKMMGEKGILNGIMCSPNIFSNDEEYANMCQFAKENKASYVLFNPLSKFGRGNQTQKFAYTKDQLSNLREKLEKLNIESNDFKIVFIRIPKCKIDKSYISECNFEIPYIFLNGDVAVCPYMIFATSSEISKYKSEKFLYGNIYNDDFKLALEISNYKKLNTTQCRKRGCIASKITNGLSIDDYDPEIYNN